VTYFTYDEGRAEVALVTSSGEQPTPMQLIEGAADVVVDGDKFSDATDDEHAFAASAAASRSTPAINVPPAVDAPPPAVEPTAAACRVDVDGDTFVDVSEQWSESPTT
jgi:hypothetical protein